MEPTQPEQVSQPEPRTRSEVFSSLIRDRRISHGGFRLWHCLYDHRNILTGACFPGQRLIAREIGCKAHSLKSWTAELESAGWLRVDRKGRGELFRYSLQDGQSNDLPLPKRATHTDAQKGNTIPLPKRATHRYRKGQRSDAQKGNIIHNSLTTVKRNNSKSAANAAGHALDEQSRASADWEDRSK